MASQVTNYKCPMCTGPMQYSGASGRLECEYCGSSFEVAEVEAMFKEQEEKAAEAKAQQDASSWNTDEFSTDWGAASEGMKSYSCPSCGAELICDETTAATCCPYCGNPTVIPGQFSGALKPEFIIPFKKDKASAVAALKEHYKGKRLLPNSFVSGNHIDDIQGVYVPFWMFDASAREEAHFHGTTSSRSVVGNKEIITTKHYDVLRNGEMSFEKIPVDASSRMPDGHMDSIEPYDYSELKAFSTAYMPGYLADKYDVEAEACGERMEVRCSDSIRAAVRSTTDDYESVDTLSERVVVNKGAVHYAMLPVWLLATKWNNQDFLFAMNGQTGKLVGDLPVDKKKALGWFAGIFACLCAIFIVVGSVIMDIPLKSGTIFLDILIPLLIAAISLAVMKGKMKSVGYTAAGKYVTEGGLKLSLKTDRFMRTTTEERIIEKNDAPKS